jgi:hypothetical protein
MTISAPSRVAAVAIGLGVLVPSVAVAEAPSSVAPSPHTRVARAPSGGPAGAVMPGFETLADGSSRLFVQLSKPVAYDTKSARGSVTYVLKSARVLRRNNTNPLVTIHFNTPVTTARLVPHGRDLWFVVELRASVQPTVSMSPGKDGSAVMQIELPKGAYLPLLGSARTGPTAPSSAAAAHAPQAASAVPSATPAEDAASR